MCSGTVRICCVRCFPIHCDCTPTPPHAALLGAAKLSQIDKDGMVDRAYRLHYNESQRRTDLFAAVSHFNTFSSQQTPPAGLC